MSAALRKTLRTLAVVLFWLLIWQLAAALVGQELLLPSPLRVARELLRLAGGAEFWLTVAQSIRRVLTGIASAVLLGILLALLTHKSALLRALLSPVMTLVKSTPVASFIILALVWLGRDVVPPVIAALMVLPVVWANVSQGLDGIDPQLLELAQVFRLPRGRLRAGPGLEGRDRRGGADRARALDRQADLRGQDLSRDHRAFRLDRGRRAAEPRHRETAPAPGRPHRKERRRPCLN